MITIKLDEFTIRQTFGKGASFSLTLGGKTITSAGVSFTDYEFIQLSAQERNMLTEAITKNAVTVVANGQTITALSELEGILAGEHEVVLAKILKVPAEMGLNFSVQTAYEDVTIAVGEGLVGSGGAVLSTMELPADSFLIGASAEVLTAPGGGATTFDMGRDSKAANELVDGAAVAAGTKATSWEHATPVGFAAVGGSADKIELSTDADVTTSDMVVQVQVIYATLTI